MDGDVVLHLGPLQLVHEMTGDELHRLIQVESAQEQQVGYKHGDSECYTVHRCLNRPSEHPCLPISNTIGGCMHTEEQAQF